jgi:hypothetical protein
MCLLPVQRAQVDLRQTEKQRFRSRQLVWLLYFLDWTFFFISATKLQLLFIFAKRNNVALNIFANEVHVFGIRLIFNIGFVSWAIANCAGV